FARREAHESARAQLALGLVVMLVALAALASLPRWATGDEWPPFDMPPRWNAFWLLFALVIGWRCVRAVIDPQPAFVQAAVRNCIFSLIVLDAGLSPATHGTRWALVILALLIPGMLIGRWINST